MAAEYKFISWSRTKIIYDLVLVAGIALYLTSYFAISTGFDLIDGDVGVANTLVRGLGTCAFVMLTVVLSIGPLARLSPRFKPLLYNRRHFGVTTFLVAATHATCVILLYYGFDDGNPFVTLFTENTNFTSLTEFPYKLLGVGALAILFVMAATSHDLWLAKLTPGFWKAMHMLVYVAYTMLVFHIVIGAVEEFKPDGYTYFAGASAALLITLHLAAGFREYRADRGLEVRMGEGWLHVGKLSEIVDQRAIIVPLPNSRERVAVFRNGEEVHAIANACSHQNGPLGEGRIVNGCVVCPWHGYEYNPKTGKSPPPFTEEVATYKTKLEGGEIWLLPYPADEEADGDI